MTPTRFAAAAAFAFLAATAAHAAGPACAHPALARAAACAAPALDANTFLVQPPASTRWVAGHANHEHPAVVAARQARAARVDANTFLVQPPVAVSWTVQEPERVLAATPSAVTR